LGLCFGQKPPYFDGMADSGLRRRNACVVFGVDPGCQIS